MNQVMCVRGKPILGRTIPPFFLIVAGLCALGAVAEEAPQTAIQKLVKELGQSLTCSACSHSAESLRFLLGAKAKNKRMAKKSKQKAVEAALTEACEVAKFPMQIAEVGDEGERRYEDFKEITRRGGSITNLNMGPENRGKIVKVCKAAMEELGDEIKKKALSYKERLGGFNWEHWMCVKSLDLCKQTQFHKTVDEDEDEEERSDEEDL
mmetsp:Transcript_62970/g.150010  ORF Transcript_62970/g.150010 Transcript_62970/m.150010 type:complete len:209 (+) Transcript_62970:75-701(+)